MKMSTYTYFCSVADRYVQNSESIPWRWLRRKEAEAVRKQLGNISGQNVLDLGCGAGYYTERLLEMGVSHVTGVDFCEEMLKNLQRSDVTPVHADATTFSGSQPYDGVLSAGLLEFVEQPSSLFQSARRNVEKGGWFVLLMPTKSIFGSLYKRFHKLHNVSVSLFGEDDISELAAQNGWYCMTTESVAPFSTVTRLIAR